MEFGIGTIIIIVLLALSVLSVLFIIVWSVMPRKQEHVNEHSDTDPDYLLHADIQNDLFDKHNNFKYDHYEQDDPLAPRGDGYVSAAGHFIPY